MPNRSSKKPPRDINELAASIVDEATKEQGQTISPTLRHQLDQGLISCTSCFKRIQPGQPRTWGEDASLPHGIYVWCDTCKGKHTGRQFDKPEKNPHAQALGRLGGLKGGKARAAKLTPEQRKEIARKASEKRWGKRD